MNKKTYRAVDTAAIALRALDLHAITGHDELEALWIDACGVYEGRSDAWKEGDAGVAEQERLDALEQLLEQIDEAAESVRRAVESIEEIEGNAPEGAFS